MSAPHGFQPMPGAVEHSGAEDPDIATNNRCRDVGGTHYCAAGSLRLGFEGEDGSTNDTGVGLLFVTRRGGEVGLSVALTPKAMRALSAALLEIADMAEAGAAKLASDAIARAQGAAK